MKPCLALVIAVAATCLLAPNVVVAQDASWQSLPEQTLVALRIRDGQGFINKLRQRTKFGSVMLSQERLATLSGTLKEQDPEEWAEMEADMAAFDLKPEDFSRVFAGDSGLGVVAQPREGEKPYVFLLGWLNPGEDLATRMYNALGRIPEESAEDAFPVKRTDLQLAGQEVMHLVMPEVGYTWDEEGVESDPRLVDQSHLFVQRSGGRLLFGFGVPQAEERISAMLDGEEKVDYEEETNLDGALGIYARFLTTHPQGDGGFAKNIAATAGMEKAVAPGDGVMDLVVDFGGIINLVKQDPEGAMIAPFLDAYGISGLGMFGVGWSLDGNVLRGATFLQADAPRPGLLGLLDQEALPAEVPAWVPADIVNYMHYSLDLGQVYTVIKQITIETFGPMAQQRFDQVEQGSMNMLQASPAKVLSSLGQQHTMAQYTPVSVELDAGAGEAVRMPMNRTAFVWQIKDEALWQRVMGMMGMFAQMSEGKMKFAEEQGFSGWRVDHEMFAGGLFLGKGHLVLGVGSGVVEGVLSAISNPPAGAASLAGSDVVKRANGMGDMRPGIAYQVSNSDKYMAHFFPLMMDMLTQMAALEGDPHAAAVMMQMKQLLPTEAEMQGMFDIAGGQARVQREGIVGDSFFVLPPAE